tara:strand:+ start:528 stop:968 length:441 start_codon:yes stop_codon:yes gene_type:complete
MDGEYGFIYMGFTGNDSILNKIDQVESGSYVKLEIGVTLASDYDRFMPKLIRFETIDLVDDPRFPEENFSEGEDQKIWKTYRSLTDGNRACFNKIMDEYRRSVLEYCEQAGYGRNVGGGCYHIYGESDKTTAFNHALASCDVEIPH